MNQLKQLFRCALIYTFILLFCAPTYAQESAVKGTLSGTVVDIQGAVIPDATITLDGPGGRRTVVSDGEGRFVSPPIAPGLYTVSISRDGFKSQTMRSVEVFTGKTSTLSVKLEIGASAESVDVVADAGVDTTSTATGTNLNEQFYQAVPAQRNVTGLFYASAGVSSSGTAGSSNPSISGGSGLENQYVADGVSITDGAFGGIGVYSRNYGSLATGINLSFVQEVQVKTAGYEPQYGKSTGGIVQIVTKSGSDQYHGGLSFYGAPRQFEATRLQPDDFGRLNLGGKVLHQGAWDFNAELGGYVPKMKDKLFFFASFNPSWTRNYEQFSNFHGVLPYPTLPNTALKSTSYNYATKLTYKATDRHTFEASIFGDPSNNPMGPQGNTLATFNKTTFSKLDYGTRNLVTRYNGTWSPTWLVNASFSWNHNYLTETPFSPDEYGIQDLTGRGSGSSAVGPLGPLTGTYNRQGLGYYENTEGNNYGLNVDTQKSTRFLGHHTFSLGYHYDLTNYDGSKHRTGPSYVITPTMAADMLADPSIGVGKLSNAQLQLRTTSDTSAPLLFIPGIGDQHVIYRSVRGEFGPLDFRTNSRYHAAYLNDSYSPWKRVNFNLGVRWEQQMLEGTKHVSSVTGQTIRPHYTFTGNWSPRVGVSVDPIGDQKTKIYANYALYNYAIPLDMAIRTLSAEFDTGTFQFYPVADASNRAVLNPDGTLARPVLDDAHYAGALSGAFFSSDAGIAPGTKMQYLREFSIGIERELPMGFAIDARYIDRDLNRIVEDLGGLSPEAVGAGANQLSIIGNPLPTTDLFTNENSIVWAAGAPMPSACSGAAYVNPDVLDTFGNSLGGVCILNADAGALRPDGKPDGFAKPVRRYKAAEFELKRDFRSGWLMRTNYRWSQLAGNYEGAYRNDNGQSDPSLSSLFDFTPGKFGLLGDQFAIGWLNTDARHTFNSYLSYTFSKWMLKNLTLGSAVRVQSGLPINDFKAHPVYQNAGEIPVNGRGSLGRTPTFGQADLHAEYLIRLTERQRMSIGADFFNVTNQKTQLRVDQNEDRSFGVPNYDFKKPVGVLTGFQRPFYMRLSVKYNF